ncbi:cytochrome c-type biogenesis protein CcmH [Neorhizobium huautlense]|uniref:Cytochrome c-type biogenesis protein CcmH n=1 Tax=Neorhizobium huautlense TaxID=67774 RepID=A0ABT9PUL7_9HYPH|nr:c-type cytochrome biogenesis protein CcmI [Neorhizobium huautlense]MDP9838170.1 cytochrome c-type biogenesis protein CcmH [Neorhizobium huautlense]
MLLWITFACLTAAVAALLILPLARGAEPVADSAEGEAAVYRDQLRELERDKGLGLIGDEEAEYARAEIGRRLIATADKDAKAETASVKRRGSLAVMGVTLVVPAVGLCLYLALGSPWLPAQPLAARLENPGNNIELLVAKAERHLAQNPQDGAGWDLLAPIYFRTQRLGDAEMAYRNAIRFLGDSPERLAGLGETLVAANDGIVIEDARTAFEAAIKLRPDDARVRFYLALALEQAGKNDEARVAFEALARDTPPGAPWLALVNEHIVKTGGTVSANDDTGAGRPPGNPTDEDVAAIGSMAASDRQAAIRGMVDTLAARLEEEPNNIEGWLRLVRSYAVLGDRQKAAEALNTGLKTFPASGNEGRQLVALGQEMGLSLTNSVGDNAAGEGAKP